MSWLWTTPDRRSRRALERLGPLEYDAQHVIAGGNARSGTNSTPPEPASITVHLIRGSDVTDMVSVDTYRATIARLTGRNVTDAVLRRALDAHRSP